MIGSIITRGIIMLLGYVYPAYECFKVLEKNRPDVQALRFWCQYWIIIAVITILERVADVLVSWVPMYCEAKLAFIIYLWYPKTKGALYVYSSFLKPFLSSHETEIDQRLREFKVMAFDMAYSYWKLSSVFIQAKVLEFLQFAASHSSRPQQTQRPQHPPQPKAPAPVSEPKVSSGFSAPSSSQYPQPSAAYRGSLPAEYSAPSSSQRSQAAPAVPTAAYRPEYPGPVSGFTGAAPDFSVAPSAPVYPALNTFPPNYPAPLMADYTASAPPADSSASASQKFYRPSNPDLYVDEMVVEDEGIGFDNAGEPTEPRATYPDLQEGDTVPVSAAYMTRSRRRATTKYVRS